MKVQDISRCVLHEIAVATSETPDIEVCGVLGVDQGGSTNFIQLVNVAPECDRKSTFRMAGAAISQVAKIYQVTAVVHSHPGGTPVPSQTDMATFPWMFFEFGVVCTQLDPFRFIFSTYNEKDILDTDSVMFLEEDEVML